MGLWSGVNGTIYDDMGGEALSLGSWPTGLTPITQAQAQSILNPPITLAQAQTAQIAILTIAYNNAIQQPVSYTSKAGVIETYQSDKQSQQNLANELLVYTPQGSVPLGYYWVAADNVQVPFTLADLQGLAVVMGTQGWTAFQHLQTQKSAVNSATTVTQVQSIVW